MKVVWWMVGASVTSWIAASQLLGAGLAREMLLGMVGPLVAASTTWVMMQRTYTREPERLTALMSKAFAAKMVLFAAYVAMALTVLAVRPVPFVVSFTSYFIALHLAEALCLRRLFAGRTRATL